MGIIVYSVQWWTLVLMNTSIVESKLCMLMAWRQMAAGHMEPSWWSINSIGPVTTSAIWMKNHKFPSRKRIQNGIYKMGAILLRFRCCYRTMPPGLVKSAHWQTIRAGGELRWNWAWKVSSYLSVGPLNKSHFSRNCRIINPNRRRNS